jgi:hypothetical protein
VVARHDARGLAEREGLAGIRRALGELIGKAVGPEARTLGPETEGAAHRERRDGAPSGGRQG